MEQPHKITSKILNLIEGISKHLGKMEGLGFMKISPELRKENKIRTIHSTLAIEGNNLTKEQVTSIIENKIVIGSKKDIGEVQNAIEVYNIFSSLNPFSESSFKKAHKILMKGLIEKGAGKYRTQNVGVGDHIAPSFKLVSGQMKNLFISLKKSNEPILIKSCVFHYEQEFIHPFLDGNGRMGRLWQSLLLCKIDPIFECVPIENFVKDFQSDYYEVLRKCDIKGESTLFIEYMLGLILMGLKEFMQNRSTPLTPKDRLELAKNKISDKTFSRKQYLNLFVNVSGATGTRDLRFGVENKILKRKGFDRNSIYEFVDKT